jgi:transcriptional regulator with XRE-family HTH domain
MFALAKDQKMLTRLSRNREYRDSYLSAHVRAGIAYQIQALREKLGLSQCAFAKKIGMTQSVVSRLENPEYGKVTVQTLIQVALALEVALLIRFCSYPMFLAAIADVSLEALAVENIQESIGKVPGRIIAAPPPSSQPSSDVISLDVISLGSWSPQPETTPPSDRIARFGTLTALAA